MDEKTNITEKLKMIVKNRKTPHVVNKRATNYKASRTTGGTSSEGYSYSSEDD